MTNRDATPDLKTAITRFYNLRETVSARDVVDEYKMLVRKGWRGIMGDARLERLRDVFTRAGYDPVSGPATR